MKVCILRSVSGIGFSFRRGEVVDLPADVAQPLIAAGHAVPERSIEDGMSKKVAKAERAVGKPSRTRRKDAIRNA